MIDVGVNPYVSKNILDNYIEMAQIHGQVDLYDLKMNYDYILEQVDFPSILTLDWSSVQLRDFIGNKVDFECRLFALTYLISLMSDKQFEQEYNSSASKLLYSKESFQELRVPLETDYNLVNIVDLVYEILREPYKKDILLTEYDDFLTVVAFSGYDLVFMFADMSKYDYRMELNDVINNRQFCYDLLDEFVEKNEEDF